MKPKTTKFSLAGILTVLILASSCEKSVPVTKDPETNPWDTVTHYSGWLNTTQGKLTLRVRNLFRDQVIELGNKPYYTIAGDTLTVNDLKYYLGHVTLKRVDGSTLNLGNYQLLDQAAPATLQFQLDNIPAGNYTGISFLLGVDSLSNHGGLQEGALDPVWGLFWTWNTGYIFLRINGSAGAGVNYSFDQGGDEHLVKSSLDLSAFKVKSSAPVCEIDMDFNELFQYQDTLHFASDGLTVHSPLDPLAAKLARNMKGLAKLKGFNQ